MIYKHLISPITVNWIKADPSDLDLNQDKTIDCVRNCMAVCLGV